ncbi:ribosome silencing factor [Geodermatophilus sp. URMC 63]
MTASAEARETALLAAQAAADKLATDVSIVDVSERLAITDAFVLAAAPNERQVQAIVDEVEERLRRHGVKPVRREGVAEARWVLLDFVDVVVHVQHAEERAYYALERLWKDCPTIPFVDRAAPPAAAATAAAGDGRGTLSADDVDPGSSDPVRLRPDPDEASDGAAGEPRTEDELADDDLLQDDPLQDGSGDPEATGR